MKKKIKWIVLAAVIIAIPVMIFLVTSQGKINFRKGRYVITECPEYPDAYAIVTKEGIRFYNLDLNELFQEYQFKSLIRFQEMGLISGYSEEELKALSDLNKMFVEKEYPFKKAVVSKASTHEYYYRCEDFLDAIGLTLVYHNDEQFFTIGTTHKFIFVE